MGATGSCLLFRKRVLPFSETFIADQGRHLRRYEPVYVGFHREPSGIALLGDARTIVLDRYTRRPEWAKLRYRLGLSANAAWSRAIADAHPAIVHGHFLSDGIDALALGRRLGVPVVVTLYGHDITKPHKSASRARAARRCFERADLVVAISEFIRKHALEKGCPEEKILLHPIGIDLTRFDGAKREDPDPRLLFVGRLVEKKGCTYVLQAMERLADRYPGLRLRIVGDGVLRGSLEEESRRRRLNVEFVGRKDPDQIRDELSEAWMMVAPSVTADDGDAEGLGIVFVEAQATRTPVVSFESGGVLEAVESGETGLLCPERDVEGLAANIERLLGDADLRRRLGERGRSRVEQRFDARKLAAGLEERYDVLCRRAAGGH